MIVVLFGPPGAGKGTQARMLKEACGFTLIATGDILREEIKKGTDLGKRVKEIMDSGKFPSDDIMLDVFESRLKEVKDEDLILDGIPRTLNQAQKIDELFEQLGLSLDRVIQLAVEDQELVRRLSSRVICKRCGKPMTLDFPQKEAFVCEECSGSEYIRRPDDEPEAVKTRLGVYNKQTKPLLAYYEETDRLSVVDGMKAANEVYAQIEALFKRMQVLTKAKGCLYSAQES